MDRPTERVLAARVARRYYLDDRSKTEIADELGISRFRVARLLETARRDGTVRISVHSPAGIDADLTEQLQQTFGLRHAVVLDVPDDDPAVLRRELGHLLGDLLRELVTSDDVLGLAWARSLQGIAHLSRLASCPVVQLTGAQPGSDFSDVIGLVRRVAHAGGGAPYFYYAPLVAPDAASARVVRRQPDVSRANEMAREVTVAVVGIGAWEATLSTIFDAVEPDARERARALGTIGEISGALIDAQGREVRSPLSKRIIGLTVPQLEAIDDVLAVAYGAGKAGAVRAALRGRLVNGLITHQALARELLALHSAGAEGPDGSGSDRAGGRFGDGVDGAATGTAVLAGRRDPDLADAVAVAAGSGTSGRRDRAL